MSTERRKIPGSAVLKIGPGVHRKLNSCFSCYNRKRRCDKARPKCSQCKERGRTCQYFERPTSKINDIERNLIENEISLGQDSTDGTEPENKSNNSSCTVFWPFGQSQQQNPSIKYARKGIVFTNIMSKSLYITAERPEVDLEYLKSYVPVKEKADKLVLQYLTSVHPIIPILDLDSFQKLYESYWDHDLSSDLSFYILLFSVCYAGAVSIYEESTMLDVTEKECDYLAEEMRKYVSAAEMALAMSEFPRNASLVALQGSILLHSICRNDCRTDDSGSIAMLLRTGHLMELHRDPESYHGIDDPREIQVRRLLWWHLVYLDGLTSLSTGLLPLVLPDEYDTKYPLEYNSDTSGLDQAIAYCNAKFRWIECSNRILRVFYGIKRPTVFDTEYSGRMLAGLNEYCQKQIQKISKADNFAGSPQSSFAKFVISVISTFTDRCCLLFFKRAFENGLSSIEDLVNHNEQSKYIAETSSLSGSINGLMSFESSESAVHFLKEFCVYGKMPENKRFLWEIRKFQPLQAILTLLRSLAYDGERACATYSEVSEVRPRQVFSVDERMITVEKAVSDLHYLSKHTTKLCEERWGTVCLLKVNAFRLLASASLSPASSEWTSDGTQTSDDVRLQDIPAINWETIEQEMKEIRFSLEDTIAQWVWDQDSGHFLL
jgi:hypothetical protein